MTRAAHLTAASRSGRRVAVVGAVMLAFLAVAGQLVRLALEAQWELRLTIARPVSDANLRPDIVDRNGRVLATDLPTPSLFAEPSLILDPDEAVERLRRVLPGLDARQLRETLADKTRDFAWIRRGLSPALAQRIHNLGVPGFKFRDTPKRVYPGGRLAGHVLGRVNVDNVGVEGVEQQLDANGLVGKAYQSVVSEAPPVRLTIDVAVQHAVEDEIALAIARYRASGGGAIVMDADSGDVVAAGSLPGIDPANPAEIHDDSRLDRMRLATYELGSVFKIFTVAMMLEHGLAEVDTIYDVRRPLLAGRYEIDDLHPAGRPLSLAEVLVRSSNVGAGMMALEAGGERQRAFLDRLGLLSQMATDAGAARTPLFPKHWGRAETITIAYGHGIAVAPLQFAAAAATIVNGGLRVVPRFVAGPPEQERTRILGEATSVTMRRLLRRAVAAPHGSGKRADVPGYRVGGKTGSADAADEGAYSGRSINATFLAAFPMDSPRYVVVVLLNDPQSEDGQGGKRTAGLNAAPTAGRIIARIAPLLGIAPSDE